MGATVDFNVCDSTNSIRQNIQAMQVLDEQYYVQAFLCIEWGPNDS